uniref:(northern house mosquito) hypothetical protein n=1 Tax=Culex pipiens TaxID=7175 RepID=A0A8D8NCR3_CULPI
MALDQHRADRDVHPDHRVGRQIRLLRPSQSVGPDSAIGSERSGGRGRSCRSRPAKAEARGTAAAARRVKHVYAGGGGSGRGQSYPERVEPDCEVAGQEHGSGRRAGFGRFGG